jgi:integrase
MWQFPRFTEPHLRIFSGWGNGWGISRVQLKNARLVSKLRRTSIDPAKVGELLRAIEPFDGQRTTHAALRLAPYVFVRPGKLRRAEWCELDLERAEWRIPVYVFPAIGGQPRPLSENTLSAALRRIGYSHEEMTGHGFRTMASTLLNEQGWNPDLIELQLAHKERNKVRAAYNRAQRLAERRKMMQAWADYLDELRHVASGFRTAFVTRSDRRLLSTR